MIIWDRRVADWVAAQIPDCERGFGECQALGVVRNDELVAGFVYHDWCPERETIQISGASKHGGARHWATPQIVAEIFDYPFRHCQMAWMQTDPANPARAIWRKLGATEHEIPRLFGRNRDGVVLTLTDDAWKATKYAKEYQPISSDS